MDFASPATGGRARSCVGQRGAPLDLEAIHSNCHLELSSLMSAHRSPCEGNTVGCEVALADCWHLFELIRHERQKLVVRGRKASKVFCGQIWGGGRSAQGVCVSEQGARRDAFGSGRLQVEAKAGLVIGTHGHWSSLARLWQLIRAELYFLVRLVAAGIRGSVLVFISRCGTGRSRMPPAQMSILGHQ
jgi:hypothetical protein